MAVWVNQDPDPNWGGPIEVNYTEYIGRQGQDGWELAFGNDSSSARRVWDLDVAAYLPDGKIDPDNTMGELVNCIRAIVGFPVVVGGGPLVAPPRTSWTSPPVAFINRVRPLSFPSVYRQLAGVNYPPGLSNYALPFLYCTRIESAKGINFQGKSDHDPALNPPIAPEDAFNDISVFANVRARLYFESLPYDVLADDDGLVLKQAFSTGGGALGIYYPDEATCSRYVTRLGQPNTDYINLMSGLMKYAEGDLGPSLGPLFRKALPIPFTVGKIISYIDLIYRWEQVPEEAISSQSINPLLDPLRFETAIDYCLGKVNDRPFPQLPPDNLNNPIGKGGYPAGTLLLLAVKFTPYNSPAGRRLYTVDFMFKFLPQGHHRAYAWKTVNPDGTGGLDWVEISTDGVQYPILPVDSAGNKEPGKHVYQAAFFDPMFWPPTVPPTGG